MGIVSVLKDNVLEFGTMAVAVVIIGLLLTALQSSSGVTVNSAPYNWTTQIFTAIGNITGQLGTLSYVLVFGAILFAMAWFGNIGGMRGGKGGKA